MARESQKKETTKERWHRLKDISRKEATKLVSRVVVPAGRGPGFEQVPRWQMRALRVLLRENLDTRRGRKASNKIARYRCKMRNIPAAGGPDRFGTMMASHRIPGNFGTRRSYESYVRGQGR